ncbi:MAG: formylglycine-generating enzyme family protein [Deltaproteobacteria bacterium]|nr:formylglycine-generating enzyme family protein [Deltaproteobacteria bacterium]
MVLNSEYTYIDDTEKDSDSGGNQTDNNSTDSHVIDTESSKTDSDTDSNTEVDTVKGECVDGAQDYDDTTLITWVTHCSKLFSMGSTWTIWEQPVHNVTPHSFEMSISEVTVSQYKICVTDGKCDAPDLSDNTLNYNLPEHENFPVNGVSYFQALAFCQFAGGDLPSESEWEFAAKGSGDNLTYPWGEEKASCDYAVLDDDLHSNGCGTGGSLEVCSIETGNTSLGLCDMSGNVWEWVKDTYHGSYDCSIDTDLENCEGGETAPPDGSSWEDNYSKRVIRGGSFNLNYSVATVTYRNSASAEAKSVDTGFRCIKHL